MVIQGVLKENGPVRLVQFEVQICRGRLQKKGDRIGHLINFRRHLIAQLATIINWRMLDIEKFRGRSILNLFVRI